MLKNFLLILIAFVLLLFLAPKNIYASDNILKIRGYQFGKMWYPLTHPSGSPPLFSYLTGNLYFALKNPNNFGTNGIVNCSVDVISDVSVVSTGSLVDNDGNLLTDVFWGGAKFTNLTIEEANEFAKFINAGGVLYISGNGWADPSTPGRGAEYNLLFHQLGIKDMFGTERIFTGANGQSSIPINTPVTQGPFGAVGQMIHKDMTQFAADSLNQVAKGYIDSDDLVLEKKIGKGYIVVTTYLAFVNSHMSDPDNLKYYLNLFSLGCRDDWRQEPDNSVVLDVPSFKQGIKAYDGVDPVWENAVYDDGDKQALFCDTNGNGATMAECGCALTSAAMVMKYFGVNYLPNGNGLSPGSLNDYFKRNSQQAGNIFTSFGFVGGNVNWHSIDKTTALANRIYSTQTKLDQPIREDLDVAKVKQHIDAGKPVIAKVSGRWGIHWVAIKGYNPDSNRLIINDPAVADKLDGHTFLDESYTPVIQNGMVVYNETHSDFSSIQVSSTSPVSILDQEGNKVGEYSFDESYGDATSEELLPTSPAGIYTAVVKTPDDGKYTILPGSDEALVITTSNVEGDVVSRVVSSPKSGAEYNLLYDENTAGEEVTLGINIKIKADSDIKWINVKNRSVLHVTIFSTEAFDANSINKTTIKFGKTGTESSLKSCIQDLVDMNEDILPDLTCKFEMQKTGFDLFTQFATLTAQTNNGFGIRGVSEVVIK